MDFGIILVALCGMSLLCVGMIAVLAFVVLRITGGTLSGLLGSFLDRDRDNTAGDDQERRKRSDDSARRGSDWIRQQAEAFKRGDTTWEANTPPTSSNQAPRFRSGALAEDDDQNSDAPRSLRDRSQRRRKDDDDEIYDDGVEGFGNLF